MSAPARVPACTPAGHTAAGHSPDCGGLTLYDRGYNRAVVDAGHRSMVTGPKPCTCGATS